MTQQQHPITPPPELVQQWINEANGGHDPRWQEYEQDIANRAAQWGADHELEACIGWISAWHGRYPELLIELLRAARRPKPPSLKEQALEALAHILNNSSTQLGADTIRRALEQLDD
jgi:hypothetical protein